MAFLVVVGGLQFVYCVLVGNYVGGFSLSFFLSSFLFFFFSPVRLRICVGGGGGGGCCWRIGARGKWAELVAGVCGEGHLLPVRVFGVGGVKRRGVEWSGVE